MSVVKTLPKTDVPCVVGTRRYLETRVRIAMCWCALMSRCWNAYNTTTLVRAHNEAAQQRAYLSQTRAVVAYASQASVLSALPRSVWSRLRKARNAVAYQLSWRLEGLYFSQHTLRQTIEDVIGLDSVFAAPLRLGRRCLLDNTTTVLIFETGPVVIEDVNLGPFRLSLPLSGGLDSVYDIHVTAITPNMATGSGEYVHPHVDHNEVCLGHANHLLTLAIKNGSLMQFGLTLHQLMHSYNPNSSFRRLSRWFSDVCSDCGSLATSADVNFQACDRCEALLCESCVKNCVVCEVPLCFECGVRLRSPDPEAGAYCCVACAEIRNT